MIEGIRIEMSSVELREHLKAREEHHRSKAKWYEEHASDLETDRDARPNVSNDPGQSLRRSQSEHERKAGFFAILAKHLIPEETYRLSEGDLSRLELASELY